MVGGGGKWWGVEARGRCCGGECWMAWTSGGWQRQVVVGRGEWWLVEASGGRRSQMVDAKAEWWVVEANGGGQKVRGGC